MPQNKKVMLFARTDVDGSECSTELPVTHAEYAKLTDEERDYLVTEVLGDIVEIWTDFVHRGEENNGDSNV